MIQSLRQNAKAYTFDSLVISLLNKARLHKSLDTTYVAVARRGHQNANKKPKSGSGAGNHTHTRAKNNAQNAQNEPHNEPIAIRTKRAKSIGSWTPSRRSERVAMRPNGPPQLTETPMEPQWANITLNAMRESTIPITVNIPI